MAVMILTLNVKPLERSDVQQKPLVISTCVDALSFGACKQERLDYLEQYNNRILRLVFEIFNYKISRGARNHMVEQHETLLTKVSLHCADGQISGS